MRVHMLTSLAASLRHALWIAVPVAMTSGACVQSEAPQGTQRGATQRGVATNVAAIDVTGALAIITTNTLVYRSSALSAYVAARREAREVYVVTEDTLYVSGGGELVGGWADGVDLNQPPSLESASSRADAIRSWLRANYEPLDIDFALLVGDPSPYGGAVPMKRLYPYKNVERWARNTPNTMEYARLFCAVPRYSWTGSEGEGVDPTEVPPPMSDYDDCSKWLDPRDPARSTTTDYYYSNLTIDWPLDEDGDISDVIDADLGHQNVHVGRIPVYFDDADALDRTLRKFMEYGASTDTAWRKNALLVMATHFYPNGEFVPLGEATKARVLDPNGFGSFRIYLPYTPPGCAEPSCIVSGELSPPSYQSVGSVWAGRSWAGCQGAVCGHAPQSYGIVYWAAHGWATGAVDIITTGDWNLNYIPALNDARPAFVVGASCANSAPEAVDNLGVQLLGNGAVAFLGASQVSWPGGGDWANPYVYTAASTDVTFGFISELVNQRRPAGAALSATRTYLWEAVLKPMVTSAFEDDWNAWVWKNSWIQQLMIFNLYGDPTIRLMGD